MIDILQQMVNLCLLKDNVLPPRILYTCICVDEQVHVSVQQIDVHVLAFVHVYMYMYFYNRQSHPNELYSPLKEILSKVLYSKMAMTIMIYD